MGLPTRQVTIRRKLLVVFFAAVFPMFAVQLMDHVDSYRKTQAMAIRHERHLVDSMAALFANDIRDLKRQQQVLTREILLTSGPCDTSINCDRADRALGRSSKSAFIWNSDTRAPVDSLETKSSKLSDFLVDMRSGARFLLTTPVQLDGSEIGRLETVFHAGSFILPLAEAEETDGTRVWALIDGHGRMLNCCTIEMEKPEALHIDDSGTLYVTGSVVTPHETQGQIAGIEGTNWSLALIRTRRSGAKVPQRQSLWAFASLMSAVVGACIVFSTGNRFAQPIRRLALAAQALAAGDYRKKLQITHSEELAILGESINALGDSLTLNEAQVRRQSELLAGMAEAARIASSSLEPTACAKAIARVFSTHLGAEGSVVFRKDPVDGGVNIVGSYRHRADAVAKRLAQRCAASGDYIVVSNESRQIGEEDPEQVHAAAHLVGIPLQSTDGAVGAVVGWFDSGMTKDELKLGSTQADVLRAFGIHAAAAILNAEAHARTEKYSEVLEDWVNHLSSVMSVTEAISPTLNLDETLAALAKATASVLKADACGIFLPSRDGALVNEAFYAANPEIIAVPKELTAGSVTLKAFSEKRHVACTDVRENPGLEIRQFLDDVGVRSVISSPLLVHDKAIGAITVYNESPRDFAQQEIRLLTSIGLHAAVVVRNASLYTRESSIAEALQQNLVSEAPAECEGLRCASKYLPALDEARVGGDFYDVVRLPSGKVAVVLADVSGKGLDAAIHLAACKYMLKALLYLHQDDPAQVMNELNNCINYYYDVSFFVTVFCGIVDPVAGNMRYANAGHPPAILISENAKMLSWLGCTGTPAGVGQKCHYDLREVRVRNNDTLLLYTDGVTDAVKNGQQVGLEGLQSMVSGLEQSSAADLVDYLCRQLAREQGTIPKDDIAMLAISFDGVGGG